MSADVVQSRDRIGPTSLTSLKVYCGLAVAAIGAVAFDLNDWRWGTVADTSWLITVAERMAAGDRLYVDVIELNPPFSIWLYTAPERAASALGTSPEVAVRLYTIVLCLLGASLAGWLLAAGKVLPGRAAACTAIAIFATAVLVSGNGFSERDQIGALLGLPILILAAWRSVSAPTNAPRFVHWLAAGTGAGVMAMVRPYYAAVVVAAACLLAAKRRDIRVFLLPEFILSGVVTLFYLGLSKVMYPAYFDTLLPLLSDIYIPYRLPLDILLTTFVPWLLLPVLYFTGRRYIDRPEVPDFLMLGAVVAWLPYFLQGKGWAYHSYPAVLFASAALIIGVALLAERRGIAQASSRVPIVLVAILLAHIRFVPTEKPADELVAAGMQVGGRPTVGMLGGSIEIGHPLARMIGGQWIEPYCSDWLATYAIRRQRMFAAAGNQAEVRRFAAVESEYLADKKARLLREPPRILIVDTNDRLVADMLGRFGFQELLDRYDRIAADGGIALYRAKAVPVTPAGKPVAGPD